MYIQSRLLKFKPEIYKNYNKLILIHHKIFPILSVSSALYITDAIHDNDYHVYRVQYYKINAGHPVNNNKLNLM